MTGFMIGRTPLFVFCNNETFAFHAHHHFIFGIFKIFHFNLFLISSGRKQCSFVHKIGQIRSRKSGSPFCKYVRIYIRCKRFFLGMHFQNSFSSSHIRAIHNDLSVKPAWTKQCMIQYIGAIRGGKQNHAIVGLESVHFDKQLIQCLLPFIVSASQSGSSMTAHCIDLINENDAWSIFFALFKKIANTGSANTHKHFNKIRT